MSIEVTLKTSERVFEGLAMQNLLCHQCVCELVDNAIAAARKNTKIRVKVVLEKIDDEDCFNLYVIDNGVGMDINTLTDSLQLGCESTSDSRLNEHGFGLKNALATLSSGNGEWTMWTQSETGSQVLRVCGPFKSKMMIEDSNVQFPKKAFIPEDVSTIIMVKVKMSFAQTVQGRGARTKDLAVIRKYLLEHLGVAYRGFLSLDDETNDTKAQIEISIASKSAPEDKVSVSAIEVPMATKKVERFNVELGGKIYEITYSHGILDDVKRDKLIKGKDKAKYYYQGNMSTQGIDIRLGNRVIATRQFENIWRSSDGKQLSRDNHYNMFVGELCIPDLPKGLLPTTNNKTDFNLDDSGWHKILEQLNSDDIYRPKKNSEKLVESELKKELVKIIKGIDKHDNVTTEECVWHDGVRIDVLRTKQDGSIIIYELKVGAAAPIHLAQLRMYWDALVVEGRQPSEGVLVCETFNSTVEAVKNDMNQFTPPKFRDGTQSKPYNFTIQTHEELRINK